MEADLARTMDLPEIEKRLAVLKEEHEKNMENLINRQAWNYEQEQVDKYKAVEGAFQKAGVDPEEETLETVIAFEDKLSVRPFSLLQVEQMYIMVLTGDLRRQIRSRHHAPVAKVGSRHCRRAHCV